MKIETKEIFNALSLHFKGKYDFVKYNGRLSNIRCKENEFWFISLSKRLGTEERVTEFLTANFVNKFVKENKIETFAKNFDTKECFAMHEKWKKQNTNGMIEVNFEKVLNNYGSDIRKALIVEEYSYPELYTRYMDGRIRIEFIICLQTVMPKLFDKWKKEVHDAVLFPDFLKFALKYEPLLKTDKKLLRSTFLSKLEDYK